MKNLIRIGVPIALGSIVLSLVNLIDSSQCMGRLQNAAGFSYREAKALYGTYGYAQTLYNLPAAFITPLTISIIPAIAMKLAGGLKDEASKISETPFVFRQPCVCPWASVFPFSQTPS